MSLNSVPTDASSAAMLNGTSWLSNLIRDGVAGYVAVQTVKNQNREGGAVVTQDPVRVEAPAAKSPISQKTWLIAGGLLIAALVAFLFLRRK